MKYELLQKSGSWYSYGDERIGQGRENAKQFIENNEDIRSSLEAQLREKMFAHLKPAESETAPSAQADDNASGTKTGKDQRPQGNSKKSSSKAGKDTKQTESAEAGDSELF